MSAAVKRRRQAAEHRIPFGITKDTTIGDLEQLLRRAKDVEVHVRLGIGFCRVTYHRPGWYPKDGRGDTLAEALDALLLREGA